MTSIRGALAISGPSQDGAVIFVGTVRNNNNGHEIDGWLCNPAMVHRTLMDIESVNDRRRGVRVAVAHRTGGALSDAAVVIGASAPHRAAALTPLACASAAQAGCVIWKKEFLLDGVEWVANRP